MVGTSLRRKPLWIPSVERAKQANLTRFLAFANKKYGIEYAGIDMNENMLSYARGKAQRLQIPVSLQRADMRRFSFGRTVDFVYIMMGSLFAKTTEDIDSHFSSVTRALNPGGLYFLDWCVNFQWADASGLVQSWTIDKGPVKLTCNFRTEVLDRPDQMVRNTLSANTDDEGKMLELETIDVVRTIFPQEFLLLVEKSKNFEFVGWWNNRNRRSNKPSLAVEAVPER